MIAKDILDILKDHLESVIKDSHDSKKELEEDFPYLSKFYLTGFHDGVIYHSEELLDLINLLTK